ncbi:protocadherin beta-6 isoform X2 [Octopus bimaculoides]|uniref:protocadherin beta-6 isoform X2 n=1 Tax=Octopus bimaculoides TaxID=37653 RepID=UPI00071E4536|nr:protocadherin beta-6 isoform X2 [Octopus bimaculoides]|eukprot:XP_014789295.1 PREDICTED: protocadherin beta-13-like isoform X2 [Octopus bimaculoides]
MLLSLCVLLSFLSKILCVDLVYHVEEGRSHSTYIGNIATNTKLLDNVQMKDRNKVWFSIIQQSGTADKQLFNVSKNGKLYTAQVLDAESLCSYAKECFKTIKIAVRQAKTFMKILKIKIVIDDVNDHQPEFPLTQVSIQFSERDGRGTKISVPNAIDKDVGVLNSQITYQLEKSSDEPFALLYSKRIDGTSKLEIILEEKLDREAKDRYVLEVIARDGGSPVKQSILTVYIAVADENDNSPIFSQNVYNISIRNRHQKSIPVTTLFANDLDSGKNGKIVYHFSSKTSDVAKYQFILNQVTGEIFLSNEFDFNEKVTYMLFVEATDKGSPPLSSIALVLVNVINDRNNQPKIDVNFVSALDENTAVITEDTKVGSFIAYVMITDDDIGQNGKVSCNLQHDKFQLLTMNSKEFKIIVKNPVDREKEDHYQIVIVCSDKGFPPQKTERAFSIQVTDVNDVQPQFTKNTFKFLTYENEEPNFPVGFINATDEDLGLGKRLTFSLQNSNDASLPFKITDNGFISTTQSLDRERQDIYKFQVWVRDNGVPSLSNKANVIVEVMDENDNAPHFIFPSVNPFSLDVYYHPNSRNNISVLKVADRDSPRNAFFKYEIVKGNEKRLFTIDSYTGVLSFSRTVYQNDAGLYKLQCAVRDSGTPVLTATTNLSLTLIVSNKTLKMMKDEHILLDNRIHVNLVILITLASVIVSVVVVVSITACIVRCHKRNALHMTAVDTSNRSFREKRHLISQTNNSAVITGNSDEMRNRNIQLMRSRSQLFTEEELQYDWKTSTITRKLPTPTQRYIPRLTEIPNKRLNQMSAKHDSPMSPHMHCGPVWSGKDGDQYEEIAACRLKMRLGMKESCEAGEI